MRSEASPKSSLSRSDGEVAAAKRLTDGGSREIVAEGTPEQIATNPASFTGHYLAPLLERGREASE